MIVSFLERSLEIRANICKDIGLPKRLSKDKNCKRLKLSCSKLRSKCNNKLGSSLGKSASAKKCSKKLSSSERNRRVKSYCSKTCKECGRYNFKYLVRRRNQFNRSMLQILSNDWIFIFKSMADGALGLRGDTAVKPVEMELERGHELADAHQRKE